MYIKTNNNTENLKKNTVYLSTADDESSIKRKNKEQNYQNIFDMNLKKNIESLSSSSVVDEQQNLSSLSSLFNNKKIKNKKMKDDNEYSTNKNFKKLINKSKTNSKSFITETSNSEITDKSDTVMNWKKILIELGYNIRDVLLKILKFVVFIFNKIIIYAKYFYILLVN